MKVFTKGEATTVVRPDSGPWTWPEPVDVMISNTAKFEPVGSFQWREDRGVYDHHPFDLSPMGDPLMFAIAVTMLETLYQAGYAVVKLDGEEDAVGDLTRAELLAKLRVEHDQAEAERLRRLDDAVLMGEAAEAIAWEQHDAVEAEQQRAETFMRERDEARVELKMARTLSAKVRHLAEQMDGSGVKFELLELTQPQEARP